MSGMTYDIMLNIVRNDSVLEDGYYSREYDTVTYYYEVSACVLQDGMYDSAEFAEISIEFPRSMPFAKHASAMISPVEDGSTYDWSEIELPDEIMQHLIDIGMNLIGVEDCFT